MYPILLCESFISYSSVKWHLKFSYQIIDIIWLFRDKITSTIELIINILILNSYVTFLYNFWYSKYARWTYQI